MDFGHPWRAKRIQRVFEDVYLHAKFSAHPIDAEIWGEVEGDASSWLWPRFIKRVRLYRPGIDRNSWDAQNEALDVTYEHGGWHWPPPIYSSGLFYLKSLHGCKKHNTSIEVASNIELHPIVVERILDQAKREFLRRRLAEMEARLGRSSSQ